MLWTERDGNTAPGTTPHPQQQQQQHRGRTNKTQERTQRRSMRVSSAQQTAMESRLLSYTYSSILLLARRAICTDIRKRRPISATFFFLQGYFFRISFFAWVPVLSCSCAQGAWYPQRCVHRMFSKIPLHILLYVSRMPLFDGMM